MRFTCVAVGVALLLPAAVHAQGGGGMQGDRQAKIRSAMMAAPRTLAEHATIKDWDDTVLRQGTNGWTCYPDMPESSGNDPMCLDEPWLAWVHAFMNKTAPNITKMGFGYMLAGSSPESNVAPYETGPTATNEWMTESVPHIMVIVPNKAWLEGLPTKPDGGGPWVMWRNSDLVHIMVPTTPHPMVMREQMRNRN